ncbi:hypothetical protein [Mucilaginibacter ginsenosidivorans]|uniref:Lipoprotein n=1 Tax=Mucilaginibacter ginsenosidivorans TaxID=398053 RepID=A0A5B8UV96_9SPHI|nr:hypothetical protein [Mucilaginibacter ginsenosidivorans]QEC63060.1 hypothetical protein FRZ54_10875 [Mucilaginibacter ginsenosidivorans]
MKKLFIISLLLLFSCSHTPKEIASKNITSYIKSRLDNPESLELISIDSLTKSRRITSLDSGIMASDIASDTPKNLFDYAFFQRLAEKENKMNPNYKMSIDQDLNEIKSGKNVFYVTNGIFRIREAGSKELKKYKFILDTLYNVQSAQDKTEEMQIIK